MVENKRILNLHEQKFVELDIFQANTNVFQANTNASLKNLETQMGQLAQTLQTNPEIHSLVIQKKKKKTPKRLHGHYS